MPRRRLDIQSVGFQCRAKRRRCNVVGKRKRRQKSLFLATEALPKSAGQPFYSKLKQLLTDADFDRWVERRCERYYEAEEKRRQPSIPLGVYFRMLFVGYFESLDSQRGIAWHCGDRDIALHGR
jgi:hypothetical protein